MYFKTNIPLHFRQLWAVKNFWMRKKVDYGKFNIVEPGSVSPQKQVPDYIPKPSYYVTGEPSEVMEAPEIKNHRQILGMRESCKLAANILKRVGNYVKVKFSNVTNVNLDISGMTKRSDTRHQRRYKI
jgi:hypothetical protein